MTSSDLAYGGGAFRALDALSAGPASRTFRAPDVSTAASGRLPLTHHSSSWRRRGCLDFPHLEPQFSGVAVRLFLLLLADPFRVCLLYCFLYHRIWYTIRLSRTTNHRAEREGSKHQKRT